MKKFIVVSFIAFAFICAPNQESQAQVLDGIYVKEHVPARKPAPYKFLRESDVMWSKRVWRVIDLREKINHPLYYPTTQIGDRMSLIDLMIWGINNEGITPYATDDDRFTQPITRSQIDVAFGAVPKTITFTDENGNEVSKTITEEKNTSEVKQFIVKEDWFFDRQHSIMDARIIGLCPVRWYTVENQSGDVDEDATIRIQQVFWIYFPEARRIFANHEVFNQFNDAERRTFDDIFFKRKFNSFIVRESNVHDDRGISEYTLGLQSLLEAERIKKRITDYEQDLWNY
ncbi:MAG: gliding motility protein GldN [Salinivirgaceae bacterium]